MVFIKLKHAAQHYHQYSTVPTVAVIGDPPCFCNITRHRNVQPLKYPSFFFFWLQIYNKLLQFVTWFYKHINGLKPIYNSKINISSLYVFLKWSHGRLIRHPKLQIVWHPFDPVHLSDHVVVSPKLVWGAAADVINLPCEIIHKTTTESFQM